MKIAAPVRSTPKLSSKKSKFLPPLFYRIPNAFSPYAANEKGAVQI